LFQPTVCFATMIHLPLILTLVLAADPSPATAWQSRLLAPTSIEKLGPYYFIVDCWHHRAIWSRTLEPDIGRWHVLDDTLAGPHSIASDGEIYVVENTGHNAVRVYRPEGAGFRRIQEIGDLGTRPHRVRYDPATKAFYVLAADSQHLSKLVRDGDGLRRAYRKRLDFLAGDYTRSMTLADGAMYFVSGPGAIIKAEYRDDSYRELVRYRVPAGLGGMNDLHRTDDGWWYITATSAAIGRVRSLEDLDRGRYEDLYPRLGHGGTPYNLARIDGRYYLPIIGKSNAIVSFVHRNDRVDDVKVFCDFQGGYTVDWERSKALPK
jgi:hypothetical protein